MERVYLWLDRVDSSVDCILLVANIYSANVTFSDLTDAYIRLANADTNQEMSRLELGQGKMKGNAIAFAKLYRYGGGWQVMGLGLPITTPSGHSSFKALLPAIIRSGCAFPPPAKGHRGPIIVPASVVTTSIVPVTVKQQQQQQQQQQGPMVKVVPQRPTYVHKSPKVATSTIRGVAAATAIFVGGALTLGHFEPDLFEVGLNFNADGLESVAEALPTMDFAGAGEWAADGIGEAGEVIGGLAVEAAGVVGDAGEVLGSAAGDVGSAMMEASGGAGGAIGGAVSSVKNAVSEALPNLGNIASSAGSAVSNARSAISDATSGVLENAGNIASSAGSAASNARSAIGDATSGVLVNAGGALGSIGDVAKGAAQHGESAVNTVGNVAGNVVEGVLCIVAGMLGA
jgi:hypothetical protein